MLEPKTQKAKDADLTAHFTEWFCAARHADCQRSVLVSDGATVGIYGKRIPIMCEQCAEYVRYAEERVGKCPKNPKPFCTACEIKCYKPNMAEYARNVMRYSGPRSIFSRYWCRAIWHIVTGKHHAKQ
jgi:hypothetical protein